MALRSNNGFAAAGYIPLLCPDPPNAVVAVWAGSNISVSFTAPANIGGGAITSYFVEGFVSGAPAVSASGTSSPITVTGVTAGTTYSFTVRAVNKYGRSLASTSTTVS